MLTHLENIMVRTQRAIAYACPKIHVEPYRPEKDFKDAVKGFALYGAKIVRPKEMFLSKVDKEKYPDIKQEYRLEHI